MSNLVIVAIPEEVDRVWKLSSEKVPHLTLLFLGEADNNPHTQSIVQFVEHAVTLSEHGQFYLDVDHRGTLGPDDADVLFFSKRSWNLKWVKQFRGQLLQNEQIRSAYDSAQQYGAPQEWTPHLTMGYPTAPAKEPQNDGFDHALYSVCFDRIAVWIDDFDGPEFRLEWPERELEGELAVAYSDTKKAELLHYGMKGMQWGKRKTETRQDNAGMSKVGARRMATPKKIGKLDKKFEKKTATAETWVKVHNTAADHVNSKLPGFNASFDKKHPKEMKDGTLWNENHPVTKEYHAAYNKMFLDGLNKGAAALGTNASGTRRVKIQSENQDSLSEFGWALKTDKVQHADTNEETIVFVVERDTEGRITNVKPKENPTMAQTIELGKEFIAHQSVLDNPTLAEQIKGKIQSILDDVTGDADKDLSLFGDPLIRTKIKSVLEDFYKDPNVDNAVVYDALGEEFLAHYGKKGMRWGHRTAGAVKTGAKATGRGAKATGRGVKDVASVVVTGVRDAHFENKTLDGRARTEVLNKATTAFQAKDVPKINAKPEYEKAKSLKTRLRNPSDPLVKQYRKEHREAYINRLEATANSHTNASGDRQYTIRERHVDLPAKGGDLPKSKYFWDVTSRPKGAAAHAADNFEGTTTLEVIMDNDGFITNLKQQKDTAKHAEVFVDGLVHGVPESLAEKFILEHFGIKGMRWGRRSVPEAVTPTAASKVPHGAKRKTKIEVDGGENHPAHTDAIKVAESQAKLKKSGAKALSNQELRDVANRLQLENQVSVLTSSKGKQFVTRQLQNEGQQLAKKGVKTGAKKAATKVGVAALI